MVEQQTNAARVDAHKMRREHNDRATGAHRLLEMFGVLEPAERDDALTRAIPENEAIEKASGESLKVRAGQAPALCIA